MSPIVPSNLCIDFRFVSDVQASPVKLQLRAKPRIAGTSDSRCKLDSRKQVLRIMQLGVQDELNSIYIYNDWVVYFKGTVDGLIEFVVLERE